MQIQNTERHGCYEIFENEYCKLIKRSKPLHQLTPGSSSAWEASQGIPHILVNPMVHCQPLNWINATTMKMPLAVKKTHTRARAHTHTHTCTKCQLILWTIKFGEHLELQWINIIKDTVSTVVHTFMQSFIHSFSSLSYDRSKASSKAALHIVRSRASSFKWEYPLLSLRLSNRFLRLLPCIPVTCSPLVSFLQ
jgi:hypothetical protein